MELNPSGGFLAVDPERSNPTREQASWLQDMLVRSGTIFSSAVEMEVLFEPEFRKRQTTAQSSTLEVGNFNLQVRTAESTSARAAVDRGADATMFTASSFERTSQICMKENKNILVDKLNGELSILVKKQGTNSREKIYI